MKHKGDIDKTHNLGFCCFVLQALFDPYHYSYPYNSKLKRAKVQAETAARGHSLYCFLGGVPSVVLS